MTRRARRALLLVSTVAILGACARPASGPPEVHWGTDECSWCHMILGEPRYAAVVRTSAGEEARFDDIGCFASWWASGAHEGDHAWVHGPGDEWLAADGAWFAPTGAHTPMGSGLVAFASEAAARAGTPRGDHPLSWEQLQARYRKMREPGPPREHPTQRVGST